MNRQTDNVALSRKTTMHFQRKMIDRILAAKHVVVFTGAGVSQESGIPTFRDALTGLWENFDAGTLATSKAFLANPDLVWGWYEWRRSLAARCQPNSAHVAIASLESRVTNLTLATQNVDDLHERGGAKEVLHLHGSLYRPRCRTCGRVHELSPETQEEPPDGRRIMPPVCLHCGGLIRPGVVWFGEDLPFDEWGKAQRAARTCDVFFCIGTSSLVFPAASLPFLASQHGACIIQVNPNPTELDSLANYNLRGKAGPVMEALVDALTKI